MLDSAADFLLFIGPARLVLFLYKIHRGSNTFVIKTSPYSNSEQLKVQVQNTVKALFQS